METRATKFLASSPSDSEPVCGVGGLSQRTHWSSLILPSKSGKNRMLQGLTWWPSTNPIRITKTVVKRPKAALERITWSRIFSGLQKRNALARKKNNKKKKES